MKTLNQSIKEAERLLPGIPAPEGELDPRWQAIIRIEAYIDTDPDKVWFFIRKWGVHPNEDLRTAIATCLLEHLLENHFDKFFPKVRKACQESKRFAFTFEMCHKFGQATQGKNLDAFNELQTKLR